MDVSEGGDDEAVTSSMVDDVFFIVQKAVRLVTQVTLDKPIISCCVNSMRDCQDICPY